jgi:hypothetical protein
MMRELPNQPVERMKGSAVGSLLKSHVLGALPLIAHLYFALGQIEHRNTTPK